MIKLGRSLSIRLQVFIIMSIPNRTITGNISLIIPWLALKKQ